MVAIRSIPYYLLDLFLGFPEPSSITRGFQDLGGTLLGRFEKNSSRWEEMAYANIHDGSTHTLKPPTSPVLAQTFGMGSGQYICHAESKSLAPDGTRSNGDTCGLLGRYPVTASGFHLIGKETERGWEQREDISTLLPSLMRYQNGGQRYNLRLSSACPSTGTARVSASCWSRRLFLGMRFFTGLPSMRASSSRISRCQRRTRTALHPVLCLCRATLFLWPSGQGDVGAIAR